MATEFEISVLEQLSEIKSTGAATAATVTALNERLFSGGSGVITVIQSDIQELKDDAKQNVWLERLKVSAGPILVAIHLALHKIGVRGI